MKSCRDAAGRAAIGDLLDAARHDGTRAALGGTTSTVIGLGVGRQRHSEGGKALVRDQTNSGGARVVVLDRGTVEAIQACIARSTSSLASRQRGCWPSRVPRIRDAALALQLVRSSGPVLIKTGRAGLVLHDLRHRAASTALRDGHDPVTVALDLVTRRKRCCGSTPKRSSKDKKAPPPPSPLASTGDCEPSGDRRQADSVAKPTRRTTRRRPRLTTAIRTALPTCAIAPPTCKRSSDSLKVRTAASAMVNMSGRPSTVSGLGWGVDGSLHRPPCGPYLAAGRGPGEP